MDMIYDIIPADLLMCPPDHFEVVYVINPWMEGQFANIDDALAHWHGMICEMR
jgi:hypothetical protein